MAQGSLAYLDAKYGFRDIKFGTAISSLKGMVYLEDNPLYPDVKEYTRPSDKKVFGNIPVKRIVYGFYHGRLWEVGVTGYGPEHNTPLYELLKTAYGLGKPLSTYDTQKRGYSMYECTWKSDKVLAWIKPGYTLDAGGYYPVYFASRSRLIEAEMDRDIAAWRKAQRKKSISDL